MPLTDCPKLQPHDLDIERAILGAILLDPLPSHGRKSFSAPAISTTADIGASLTP